MLAARRVERLEATRAIVAQAGRRAIVVAADMALPENALAVVEAAMNEFGHVDVLVNNAGKGTAVPATRETPEQFREVIDINLNGCYWMAQACGRVMQPGSAIINIASVAALASGGLPQAAYSASKAGLIGLTRDLAVQWTGRKGIRVTALAPGYFPSEMNWRISTTDSAWCTWNTRRRKPRGSTSLTPPAASARRMTSSLRWATP